MRAAVRFALPVTALCAWVLVFIRARIQAVTMDEAVSYLIFISRGGEFLWFPASNNHLMNTLLARGFTLALGASHLTLRAPALIGAAIYIVSAYALCRLLKEQPFLEWLAFAALVLNPFVLDYLVAARGYSLAAGLLLAAIAVAACSHERSPHVCMATSACLALSFLANFSFAIVNVTILMAILVWAWRERRATWSLLASMVIPGAVVAAIGAPVVLRMPHRELNYGSSSVSEMFRSVAEASFYQLPARWSERHPGVLFLAVIALIGAAQLVWIKGKDRIAAASLAASGAAICIHWALFRTTHLLLPKDRTALYLAPLLTIAFAMLAAHRTPIRPLLIGALILCDLAFLSCLRLHYFKEWEWDADVRDAFEVAATYHRQHCVDNIEPTWLYAPSFEYYRQTLAPSSFPEFSSTADQRAQANRDLYVLTSSYDGTFIRDQGLQIIWRGPRTELVVAARPGTESRPPCNSAAAH